MTSAAITHPDIHISGDVRIDPRAVIASGVILQAAPHSYIAIAAGVCIGAGSILQAHQGNIDIQSGAIIGAGALIIGKSTIGENACIGYGTTIFRASIVAATILPPNALIGDVSRTSEQATIKTDPVQATSEPVQTSKSHQSVTPAQPSTFDPWQETNENPDVIAADPIKSPETLTVTPPVPSEIQEEEEQGSLEPEIIIPTPTEEYLPQTPIENVPSPENTVKPPVVGQVYINNLLMTLFPHQNSVKPPNPSGSG